MAAAALLLLLQAAAADVCVCSKMQIVPNLSLIKKSVRRGCPKSLVATLTLASESLPTIFWLGI
jgi:hypothetical protein